MQLTLVTPPAATPVTLAEVKEHLRVSNTKSDSFLTALIAATTQHLDGRAGTLRRALVTQTWRVDAPDFPACRSLELPLPPLQSVTSVQYYDADGVLQTFDAANYRVIATDMFGHVELVSGASWPVTQDRSDAVRVTFVAGYGAAAAVPDGIKHALKLHIADLFGSRGDGAGESKIVMSGARAVTPSESAREHLLMPYAVKTVR